MLFKLTTAILAVAALACFVPAMAQDAPATGTAPVPPATPPRPPAEVVIMAGGRQAIAFTLPPVSEPPPGFEKLTLPDGRIAFAPITLPPSILPFWAQSLVSLRNEPVTLTTGIVAKGTTIASIPFRYNKTFRLKSDRITSGWGGKRVEAVAGSPGFYGGAFQSLGQPFRMMCVFNQAASEPYKVPPCFLRWTVPDVILRARSVATFSNLPTYYQANAKYNTELVGPSEPFEVEDGDFTIDHDFRLIMTVKKWKDGEPMVAWLSEGVTVQTDTIPPGKDGTFSFPVNGGTLTLAPDPKSKSNTVVTFTPGTPNN